ncbi:MAG: class I SAM-dependent methyltransferase [Myxococcales bacterium]|nr:class I SAM-dependent methyltransferase [Myxococcales bacterium]
MDRFAFFSRLPRSEPGSATFTSGYLTQVQIRAIDRVLDLHCAAGDRATWIARSRGCRVIAVDEDPRYLPIVRQRAEEGGALHLVQPMAARYEVLPFADESFRVVMAEGAALPLGLQKALSEWRRLVPKNGHVTVTYPGIVNKDAPPEVREPLERRMVEPLRPLADLHTVVRNSGYELAHQVPLQPELWDAFYADVVRHAWALTSSRRVRDDEPTVKGLVEEARWFRRIGRGRVFLQAFVLRRVR